MPRSLIIRSEFLDQVKSSLLRNGFPSQKLLAEELGLSQSTVSNFLNGKPVDYINFVEICQRLGQEWRDVANLEDRVSSESPESIKVKILVSGNHGYSLAEQLETAFKVAGHTVFLSYQQNTIGSNLSHIDYLLILLSAEANASETILEEVRLTQKLHDQTPQKPAILPLYIQNSDPIFLSFDLLSYFQDIQGWQWQRHRPSALLAEELLQVFKSGRKSLPSDHEFAISWTEIVNSKPSPSTLQSPSFPLPTAAPEIPEGQVELESDFYIQRPPIESRCYETILQPGALIRIKAPRQMGKTSLMARVLHHAQQRRTRTVALSLQLANQRVFRNSDTFLQWFCASVSLELGLLDSEQLAKYAQLAEIIGSNQSCKAYFEQYLLPTLNCPLTLGLDEVDRVFESPEIADDFFGLLRSLHEEAKRREVWKNFRLIVVHSTEVYIPLDVNKSPFNVGLPIELPEFNPEQVQALAKKHGLNWGNVEVAQLMNLVGGHPYLVRLALYHLAYQDITLSELVEDGITETGIYRDHLRRHLWNLEKYEGLMKAFQEVVCSSTGVRLRSELAFKLNSMGLIKLVGNECWPRCRLYQQYFRQIPAQGSLE